MPQKSKRLRVMAGPNGSGKSSILRTIQQNYKTGPFINADEIHQELSINKSLPLSSFGLKTSSFAFNSFLKKNARSWVEKIHQEGIKISVRYSRGNILAVDGVSPYDSALVADFLRQELIEANKSFTFETVMSHTSKIDLLRYSKDQGYKNYLYFICTTSPEINVARVAQRVKLGGHHVPEHKIFERYSKSLHLLADIIPLCHRAYFFDNSTEERNVEPVAEIDPAGKLKIWASQLPWWVQTHIIEAYYER